MIHSLLKGGLVGMILLSSKLAMCQDDWKKLFPNAEAVYTNLSNDIIIKQEDDKWIATSNLSEDLLYLTGNSVNMMSRGRIYHSSFNELQKWDAYVQPPSGKKVKVSNAATTSSRQDYIFYDDTKSTSFDYAGASVGATRHMNYQLKHNDVHLLTPHYFERYFPVGESKVTITFPADIKLKYIIKGLNAEKVVFSETKKRDKTTYTFTIRNVENIDAYEDAPDNAYYSTHLIYFIEQIKENGSWKNFLSNPADLYKHNYSFIRNINKEISQELKTITDSIVKNISSPEEKAKKIYKWVQSNIKYVAFEDGMEGFIPRDASLVCNRKYGDCKDMTSILTAMLNYANVPAYFTWIGTRSIPYDYTEVPLPISDNHMICAIRSGDSFLFLDGTDDGCIYGFPPYSIQGKEAMIAINENEFKIVRVPVTAKQKNTYTDSTFIRLQNQELIGQVRIRMTGYHASRMQTILNFKNEKEEEEYLKKQFARGSNKIRFSNWKTELNPDHSEVLIMADFNLPDYARNLDSEIFLNLNLFKWYEHREIDFPKRKAPIEFDFLETSTFTTIVKIPEGYKLSHLPKGEIFKNDTWGFSMKYTADTSSVYLTQAFDTDQLLLKPGQFEPWNKVLEHLFPHYKHTVAFSKN